MKFYHLVLALLVFTRPDGFPVYVKSSSIDYFTSNVHDGDSRAKTMIQLDSGNKLYVREDPAEVRRLYERDTKKETDN